MTEAALPPRLSDHQRFVLALLAAADGEELMTRLSWATAREFGSDHGDRYHDEDYPYRYWSHGSASGKLTDEHTAAFARTVARLDDRGLIERLGRPRRPNGRRWSRRHSYTQRVRLTDEGETAAREIHHRARDGRYALSFDALDTADG